MDIYFIFCFTHFCRFYVHFYWIFISTLNLCVIFNFINLF